MNSNRLSTNTKFYVEEAKLARAYLLIKIDEMLKESSNNDHGRLASFSTFITQTRRPIQWALPPPTSGVVLSVRSYCIINYAGRPGVPSNKARWKNNN